MTVNLRLYGRVLPVVVKAGQSIVVQDRDARRELRFYDNDDALYQVPLTEVESIQQ